jgi:hypothetical protein
MTLTRRSAVQFLVRTWEQVRPTVLAKAQRLYYEPGEDDSGIDGDEE